MKEVKDPEIKLFGKKIFLSDNGDIISVGDESSGDSGGSNNSKGNSSEFDIGVEESGIENEDEKIGLSMENCKLLPEENNKHGVIVEESQNIEVVSVCENSPESISMDDDVEDDDQGDTNTQQKTLKKPDKIIPCPRCTSMDTKFCYYNNYNVNQPRHFCKSCQRYWTDGGTMRNVPVGAGRRKNKNFGSHSHPITVSEAFQGAQMDAPNGFHHPIFKSNGTILSFGQDLPVCDPVSSVFNLTNKKSVNGCSNGQQEPVLQQMSGFSTPVPYHPGVPWPNPWNSAIQMPALCPPGYHIPVYPSPLWNYNMTGSWSYPWLAPLTPPVSQNSSSTLGKHTRNGETIRSKESEGNESQEPKSSKGSSSILVPKTLRIDDPEEAAKSSIWTTLGIKYDSMSNKGKLFKAFEQKTNEKNCVPSAASPTTLQVNPAALSRSLTFQERV